MTAVAPTLASLPPQTLADLNRKITVLTTPPTSPLAALTVTELEAGIEASCRVAKEGTRFSASGSDTVEDGAVCQPVGASVPGKSNYEASIVPFRFFDEEVPGSADALGDVLFQALRIKGTPVTIVERHSNKKWDEPWAAGDEYSAYSVTTDNWQKQSDQHAGYIKHPIPLFVSDAEQNGKVAAGA